MLKNEYLEKLILDDKEKRKKLTRTERMITFEYYDCVYYKTDEFGFCESAPDVDEFFRILDEANINSFVISEQSTGLIDDIFDFYNHGFILDKPYVVTGECTECGKSAPVVGRRGLRFIRKSTS